MYVVTLKKGKEKKAEKHPWVYANEVQSVSGKGEQGSVCSVLSSEGKTIGYGFICHASKILVRFLSREKVEVGEEFFRTRILRAKAEREALGFSDNYRAVFSENDGLPGLIVDKYSDHLSVQFLSLGVEKNKETIVKVLAEIFAPACIYERSDSPVREKEGLPQAKGVLFGALDPNLTITENGLKLRIDLENGQKTGYFLDQKQNRAAIRAYAKGKRVLDLFSNQGGFALNAASAGASEVLAVDVSESALAKVEENAALNGFTNVKTVRADVFEFLRNYKKAGERFDLIVLDPPAFTKTADTVRAGYEGYVDINSLALKLLNEGGVLFTCSCSQHLTLPLFLKMAEEASDRAGVKVKLAEIRTQSPDHAAVLGMDEALYLKALALIKCR